MIVYEKTTMFTSWQAALPPAPPAVPLQPNQKYLAPLSTSTTGSGSFSMAADGSVQLMAGSGTSGGTCVAYYNFNKGPVVSLAGYLRWDGATTSVTLTIGGAVLQVQRLSDTALSFAGQTITWGGLDAKIKIVTDANAKKAYLYDTGTTTPTLKLTTGFNPNIQNLTGNIYFQGRSSSVSNNGSYFHNQSMYNNIDMKAS